MQRMLFITVLIITVIGTISNGSSAEMSTFAPGEASSGWTEIDVNQAHP